MPHNDKPGKPFRFELIIDNVDSEVPCVVSIISLSKLEARIDFSENATTVRHGMQIQLTPNGGGHMQLPEHPDPPGPGWTAPAVGIFPVVGDLGKEAIAEEQPKRIRLHLGHCSEFAMRILLRHSNKTVPEKWPQICFGDDPALQIWIG